SARNPCAAAGSGSGGPAVSGVPNRDGRDRSPSCAPGHGGPGRRPTGLTQAPVIPFRCRQFATQPLTSIMNRTLAVTFSAILAAWMIPAASHAQLADSRTDFSGTQGQDGWFYGYRSYTLDGGGDNYDPVI